MNKPNKGREVRISGNTNLFVIPEREKIDGVEKLNTMSCDDIDPLLSDAYVTLHRAGQHLMAEALLDLVFPIMKARERAEYRYVLASQCPPGTPGEEFLGSPEDFGLTDVDPAELHECWGDLVVTAKRVKIQG
jgi:hypothetical protein